MTDKELLIKIIIKAQNNGYKTCRFDIATLEDIDTRLEDLEFYGGEYDECWTYSVMDIIFSHDFAKAFFGTADEYGHYIATGTNGCCGYCGCPSILNARVKCWEYFLQKLVLEEAPLKYLERFLDD